MSNIELFSCFWLDEHISQIKDDQIMLRELRKIINHLQIFNNRDECEQRFRNDTQEKIVLVTSNSLAHQIIPRVHDLSQFSACYIFSPGQIDDKRWINKYSKIKDIFDRRSELLDRISKDQIVRIRIEDYGTVSVVIGDNQSLETRNAMFMWFQLFIEVLLRMHNTSNTRQELIDLCQEYYQKNSSELSIIDEFKKTYKNDNAIWCDLAKQLTKEYERCLREMPTRDVIRVYRGQAIGLDELKLIQSNIGEFISMNSFLSTSLHRQTAVSFLHSIEINNDLDRILFEVDIDPRQNTVPFSHIDRLSYFENEQEILIMVGALFRIQSVNQDKTKKFWIASVILASEDDFHLKETFAHMKEKIGDETNLHSLGKILTEMGQYEQAQKCYRRMIYEAEFNESIGYAGLGWADHWLNNYDTSLNHLQKSLTLMNEISPEICEEKGRLYSSIGLVYWRKKQYEEALKNLTKAFNIQKIVLSPEHPDILATYNRFAITYSAMNDVEKALEYYNKCLTFRLATLPHDHPDIATSYNNLGWLYNERIGDYTKALDYFQKALTICRKILPPTHRDIIRTEQNIRKVNEKLKK